MAHHKKDKMILPFPDAGQCSRYGGMLENIEHEGVLQFVCSGMLWESACHSHASQNAVSCLGWSGSLLLPVQDGDINTITESLNSCCNFPFYKKVNNETNHNKLMCFKDLMRIKYL